MRITICLFIFESILLAVPLTRSCPVRAPLGKDTKMQLRLGQLRHRPNIRCIFGNGCQAYVAERCPDEGSLLFGRMTTGDLSNIL